MRLAKRILPLALALALMMLPAAGAAAEEIHDTGPHAIPFVLTAEATTFNVTLPTAFPITVDADGVAHSADAAEFLTITNHSAGAVRVFEITVKGGDWTLAPYDGGFDFANADVDSNRVGLEITPSGGRARTTGTALATTSGEETQTLLDAGSPAAGQWVLDAENDGDTDQLTIDYSAKVTPISADIYSAQVASIIITIGWNTAT